MKMTLLQVIQLGRKYLKLWPERTELLQFFAEYRQITVSRFVCRYSWHFAALIIALPFAASLPEMFSNSLVSALFISSMPLQVYIMLGLQADKFLPPSLASWYREGVAKINQQGGSIKLSVTNPKYIDLVNLLDISYRKSPL
ncbi:MAG: terminus macrodomain insulation protein YfbV [Thalassotalea sp.]